MADQTPFDGSIVITPKEFYDGVKQDIGEIKDSVSSLREELSGLPARVSKLEQVVENLKTKQTWVAGFAAGLSAAVSYGVTRLMGL
jgi:cell division protein FtsB